MLSELAAAGCVAWFIRRHLGETFWVKGRSMLPTLKPGQILWLKKKKFTLERGMIIVFKDSKGRNIIKRVIGLPGELLEIRKGLVYINDELLEEDYRRGSGEDRNGIWFIPPKEVFLMGDNREPGASYDSRYFGPLEQERIVGQVIMKK